MSTTESVTSKPKASLREPQRAGTRDLQPLKRLAPFVFRYRMQLVLALISLLMAAAATLIVPLAVRRVIDHGFSSASAQFINQYFGMMLIVVAVLALSSAARFYFVTWLGERVVADVRDAVFSRLIVLSPEFHERMRTGELMSRLTADTTQIKSMFGSTASVALRNLVLLAGAIVMMVITSPKLSGLTLLALPLIIVPLVIFGRRVRGLSRQAQDALADSAALAQESLDAIAVIQSYVQETRIWKQFSKATSEAFDAARKRTVARAILTAAIIFMAFGSVVAVLWFGAQEVLAGRMTGGALGQFVLYTAFAAGALGSLSEVWGEVQLAAGAAERLSELLDSQQNIVAPSTPKALPAQDDWAIRFDGVSFTYPSRPDSVALDNLCLDIAPGETVALVGPSGAGKSTVFSLLLRFYDVTAGSVNIADIDIRDIDPDVLRKAMALVPQDTVIFSGTILDNIRFGRPDATRDEILSAAKAAHVDEFVDKLPDGFDTWVGERGLTLSGGQRQRLSIARAVLSDAPILLLDEATSALDSQSERLVQDALDQLSRQRTTLVIAHRLGTVRNADRIIVMENGQSVASGTHDALLQDDGLYARLAQLQFSAK